MKKLLLAATYLVFATSGLPTTGMHTSATILA